MPEVCYRLNSYRAACWRCAVVLHEPYLVASLCATEATVRARAAGESCCGVSAVAVTVIVASTGVSCLSVDGTTLLSGGGDGTMHVFDLEELS